MINSLGKLKSGAGTLLAGILIMSLGSYLVIPILAVYLKQSLGFTASEVALALTVKLWAQEGLALLGGICTDRWGVRRTMLAGLCLRAAAFLGLAACSSKVAVVLSCAMIGAGAALYIPGGKVALMQLSSPEDWSFMFSVRNMAGNVGAACGPILGLLFAASMPRVLFIAAFCAYLIFLAILLRVLTSDMEPAQDKSTGRQWSEDLGFLKRPMLWSALLLGALIGVFMQQMEISLPLFSNLRFHEAGPRVLFSLNGILVVLLQLPAGVLMNGKYGRKVLMAAGFLFFAGSFLILRQPGLGWFSFLACVSSFTAAEVVVLPLLDRHAVGSIDPRHAGSALGLVGVFYAIGGSAGNFLVGAMSRVNGRPSYDPLWRILFILAVTSAILAFVIDAILNGRPRPDQENGRSNPEIDVQEMELSC